MSNYHDCSFKEGHDYVFKCLSCSEIPEHHVFQCSIGHSICGSCVDGKNLERCPTCDISYDEGKNRNLALEWILDGLQFECPFKDAGCIAVLGRAGIRNHRAKCPFRSYAFCFCKRAGFPNCSHVMVIRDRDFDVSPVINHLTHFHEVEVKSLPKEEHSATIFLSNFHELRCRPSSSSSSLSTASNSNSDICTVSPTILTCPCGCVKLFVGPVISDGYIAFICAILESAHPEYQLQVEFTIKSNQKKRDLKWTIPAPGIKESLECLMRFPVVELQKSHMRLEDKTLAVTVSYIPHSRTDSLPLITRPVSRKMQSAVTRVTPYNFRSRKSRNTHLQRSLQSTETPQHGSTENTLEIANLVEPGSVTMTQEDEVRNGGPPAVAIKEEVSEVDEVGGCNHVTIKQEVNSDSESDSSYPFVSGSVINVAAESQVPVSGFQRKSNRSTKGISSRYLNDWY